MTFRKDINGMRALAVMGVVLFHFNLLGVSGGYTGVDVFFVLSGFLMTSILYQAAESSKWSLTRFYAARIRRIYPAMLVLTLATLAFGYAFMAPLDYRELGREAYKALTFLSNIFYAQRGGYFDPVMENRFLLHMWSLALEWQFYLLFPFLFLTLSKIGKANKLLLPALVGLFCLSFIANLIHTYIDQPVAFFLLHTRIWEFMAGSLAFVAGQRQWLSTPPGYFHI